MNLKNRFVNAWTVLGVLFGLFMGFLYGSYTTDVVRALLYGAAAVLFGVLVFNLFAYLFSDAYEEGLSAVIGLVFLQTVAAVVLAVLSSYTIFRLPYVPAGDWIAMEPAPERLVDLVDTTFANGQKWAIRAKSINQNTFVCICHFRDGCNWQTEQIFLEQDLGELSSTFEWCQETASTEQLYSSSPRHPRDTVDTHIVYQCGTDSVIVIHLALTEDGTVWYWRNSFSALTGIGMIFWLVVGVIFVFFVSIIIGLIRLRQYRHSKIQRRERAAHSPHPGS